MGTVADKLNLLLNTKSSIRDAIAAMGQSVAATAAFSSYAAKIRAISSDATAAAADILSGKTAYAGGKKITGTIAGRGASDLTASGAAVSVPAGYYPEDVSKSVATTEQAVPGISVSSNGLITASATQGAGYVAAGTKSATRQLTTQAAATITPGTSAKTAVAAGRFTTGAVQVAGDANLVAGNIKGGVSIFGVEGSFGTPSLLNIGRDNITISNGALVISGCDPSAYAFLSLALTFYCNKIQTAVYVFGPVKYYQGNDLIRVYAQVGNTTSGDAIASLKNGVVTITSSMFNDVSIDNLFIATITTI